MPISLGTHVVYTVRTGDTLYQIANQFGASLPEIVRTNALYPPFTEAGLIYPGQKLLIHIPCMAEHSIVQHQATEGDTLYGLAERYSIGLDMLLALNPTETPDILRVGQLIYIPAIVYEVDAGDTAYRISRRFGASLSELVRANRNRAGFSTDVLFVGYQLVVPLPSSTNILIYQPLAGATIRSGQPLVGIARAFEATILYQIRDAAEQIATRERPITTSEGAPAFGQFNIPLQLESSPTTPTGSIFIYTRSARDGSIQDLVEVPIYF